jgi:tripartite-type tricarboxylate transporter receptor subunit TctC
LRFFFQIHRLFPAILLTNGASSDGTSLCSMAKCCSTASTRAATRPVGDRRHRRRHSRAGITDGYAFTPGLVPAANLQEFIAYTKTHQAQMQFGSGGPGSATHLACVLLNSAIGVKVTHVPYRSAAIGVQDMIAGRIDYLCPIVSTAVSQIEGKQVKPIAILSKERAPILPDLASAHEQGLIGFDAYIWNGLFLPRGTPSSIAEKLHDAAITTMDSPDVQQRIKEMGGAVVSPERRSSAYLQGFVESEIKKWAAPIKASGVSMD